MKKKFSIYLPTGILLIGISVLGIYLFNLSRQPLNRPLILLPQATASAPSTLEGTNPSLVQTATVTESASASINEKVCGQRGAFTILIIGSDADDMRGQPGSDLTRLARVDFSQRKVSTFALSRDLRVDVSRLGFQDPLITETTLGKVYYEGHERSILVDEPGKMTDGVKASAQMILDNFGVTSGYYLVIDLDQLPTLVDAVGGLPVDIPEQTTDPWIGMVFEAGPQTLSGEQLRAYARANPNSDFDRIEHSNIILHALRQKLLEPSVWMKLPILYDKFKKMIVTDLSPQQIFSFFCLLQEVPREEIVMEQVEPEWTSPGPSDSLLWDKDKVIAALKNLNLLP